MADQPGSQPHHFRLSDPEHIITHAASPLSWAFYRLLSGLYICSPPPASCNTSRADLGTFFKHDHALTPAAGDPIAFYMLRGKFTCKYVCQILRLCSLSAV